jgi:hypothetical protein
VAECCEELAVLAVVEGEQVLLHLDIRVTGIYQWTEVVQRYIGSTEVVHR